jgi:hypothetical protein
MGALVYGTFLGGTGLIVPSGLALAPDGSIFLGGYTTDSLPVTGSAWQSVFGGGYTAGFVTALK